jgi:hypothetical protein
MKCHKCGQQTRQELNTHTERNGNVQLCVAHTHTHTHTQTHAHAHTRMRIRTAHQQRVFTLNANHSVLNGDELIPNTSSTAQEQETIVVFGQRRMPGIDQTFSTISLSYIKKSSSTRSTVHTLVGSNRGNIIALKKPKDNRLAHIISVLCEALPV